MQYENSNEHNLTITIRGMPRTYKSASKKDDSNAIFLDRDSMALK